jgi:2-methylcitrate dehydratase
VFAALMARDGMPGLAMPFEGEHAWCEQIARKPLNITEMGGPGVPFKVEVTLIKQRNICAATIGSALAAEPLGQQLRGRIAAIGKVKVEVYGNAKKNMGTGAQHWNPTTRETADHSIPYVVSAGLLDGAVTAAQFDDAHLADPTLRALLAKVEVEENPAFSALYTKHPAEHHARITVQMSDGETLVGEAGGAKGDLGSPRTDAEISAKFLELTEPRLGAKEARSVLERLWDLDNMKSVAAIAPAFVVKP